MVRFMTGTYFSVRCKNFVEEVISVRLQVGEHIGGLEVDGDIRVESSIFGFVEFLCVFIGWLKCLTCCPEECLALSLFRLLCLRVDRGSPVGRRGGLGCSELLWLVRLVCCLLSCVTHVRVDWWV